MGLILVVGAAFACIVPAQNDTWWHLRSGLEMWDERWFVLTERFSHTNFGAELRNHWWLSQLLFYGTFAAGGPPLLTVVAGACAWTAVLGAYLLTRGAWELRFVSLIVLLLLTAPEWAIRPQVISLAFLVLCSHLVVTRRAIWLPVVCLVWANTHGMVIFGIVIAGAVAAEAVMFSRRDVGRAAAVLAATVAVPMVSPLGWHYWPQVLETVSVSRELALQEYRTPELWGDVSYWLFAACFVGAVVARRHALSRMDPGYRTLLIAGGVLMVAAFMAVRNVAFFAVVAVPAVTELLAPVFQPRPRRGRPAPWPAYALLALVVAGVGGMVVAQWRDGGARLGWRPISAEALAAVRACPDPIFNSLEDGGPLMWHLPERRVFVDSRMEAYPLSLLRRSRAADVQGDYVDLFADYGVRCTLVATGSPMDGQLSSDPSMTATFTGAGHRVFVRNAAESP